jgi:hypothetical protein
MPINKSHLRSHIEVRYLLTQVTESPWWERRSGGQK